MEGHLIILPTDLFLDWFLASVLSAIDESEPKVVSSVHQDRQSTSYILFGTLSLMYNRTP
jgi:hypothetical protein